MCIRDRLNGVRMYSNRIETHTLVMRSYSRTVRHIRARHYDREKFGL